MVPVRDSEDVVLLCFSPAETAKTHIVELNVCSNVLNALQKVMTFRETAAKFMATYVLCLWPHVFRLLKFLQEQHGHRTVHIFA